MGFESQSKNRGRAEKSRLKKESPDFNPMIDAILDEVIDEYQINEGTNQMTQVYKDLDKKFKKYDHTRIQDFGKVSKYLKTKFSKGSSLPDTVASFYNDYRGGEDMKKNIDKLTKYAKKMSGYKKESVDEAIKNWNDVPKKGTIDFGKYGKYVILSKNRLRVSGKFVSGTNKGKKVIWYSRDGQKDYRKRKGLSLADTPSFPFNQVKESVKEADLGLTYKRGKTVKVKHKKSGKTLVIVDKPVVRKEYEKIGYFAESVNEKVNPEMKKIYQLLIKYGNSAKDATAMIKKNLKYVNKTYRNSTPRGKAIALVGLSSLGESVNEKIKLKSKSGMGTISHVGMPKASKGVEKLFKIADSGYGKVGGVTVDSMSANLFKQIYNKANDDIKKKLNTKNEKQLVKILGGMWKKFGKNVSIGSSL